MTILLRYLNYDLRNVLKNKRTIVILSIILIAMIADTLYVYHLNVKFSNFEINRSLHFFLESLSSNLSGSYIFMMPIIAILPLSGHLYSEQSNNYHIDLIIRGDRIKYYISKIITSFLIGFITVFFLLIINYILVLLIYPESNSLIPAAMLPGKNTAFGELYFNDKNLYYFMYIIINASVGGLFSSLAFSVQMNIKSKNEFYIVSIPVVIIVLQSVIIFFISPYHDILHIIQIKTRYAMVEEITIDHIVSVLSVWVIAISCLNILGFLKLRELK